MHVTKGDAARLVIVQVSAENFVPAVPTHRNCNAYR